MKERGMIFNGEMVRAILDGRKTQTRRPVKPQPELTERSGFSWNGALYGAGSDARETNRNFAHAKCPFGKPGDRIWARETFADVNTENGPAFTYRADDGLKFCLDDESPVNYDRYPGKNFAMWCGDLWRGEDGHIWTPSIHMPRWASRILLEITDVRVERLNSISEIDANQEGMMFTDYGVGRFGQQRPGYSWKPTTHTDQCLPNARMAFANLWESIYGDYTWRDNPWVWVIEFSHVKGTAA